MSSCYHPLRALRVWNVENINTGDNVPKSKVVVLKGQYDPDAVPINMPENSEYIPLPCGRCIGCRLQYSREWADRCMLEATYHKDSWFLTLTYDDDHLPRPFEGSDRNPLVKRDLQLFVKRLRRTTGQKIRYFACGEYSPSGRPHYHIILFGLHLDDLKIQKYDRKNGFVYYTSDVIYNCWYPESDSSKSKEERSSNGFHLLTSVSWDTCAYTARYVMKKQKGEGSSVYEKYNYTPEFTIMSRKPGIAAKYFEDNPEIIEKPKYIPTNDGSKMIRSNKYFDKLFDIYYPDEIESIKENRKNQALKNDFFKSQITSMSYKDRLRSEEINKAAAIMSLKRKEVK